MATTERVGIEIDIKGYKEAVRQMEQLDAGLKSLQGRKVRLQISGRIKELQRNLVGLRSEMARLQELQAGVAKGSAEWNNYAQKMRQVRQKMREITAEAQGLKAALNNVRPLSQVFNKISTSMAHMGSAMQSAGNAIQRFMTPFRMMSTGALLGAGFGAMSKVTEGLSSGFARYDIMKKYPRMMEQLGYSSEAAEKSVERLNQAVIGLPTGLDEIVQMAQRYTMSLGDMEKGEKTAIAVNNAFLASMSTEPQRYQGMMQIQDLLNGKKLRSQEWESLFTAMSAGINEVGEALGYSDIGKFQQDLKSGEVSIEQFLKTLRKVGTGKGSLAEMANLSKDTWDAFSQNVTNAFSRMTYGILTSADKIVETLGMKNAKGEDILTLNQLLSEKVTPGIDKLAESTKKWIDSHPDEIKEFFSDLASVDWKGLGKGFIDGIGDIIKAVQSMAKWLGGRNLEGIGKGIVYLNMIGQGLLVVGGLFKGLRGIGAAIGTVGVGISRALSVFGAGKAAAGIGKIAELIKGVGNAGKAAEAAGGAAQFAKFGSVFRAFVPALEAIAGVGAMTTLITGIAALDTKLLSMAMNNVKTITEDIGTVLTNIQGIKNTKVDADALRTAVNTVFGIYDIIYGETTGYRATGKTFQQQRENGLNNMNKGGLADIADNMENIVKTMDFLGQLKGKLSGITGFATFDPSVISGLKEKFTGENGLFVVMSDIMSALDTNIGGMQADVLAGKMESIVAAIQSIKQAGNKLASMGSAGFGGDSMSAGISGIKTMIQQLGNALNTETVADISMKVGTLKQTIDNLISSLNTEMSGVAVTVHIDGDVTGDDDLVSKVNKAKTSIQNAVKRIPSDIYKYVTVHINGRIDKNMPTIPAINQHTGGLVGNGRVLYRSRGGGIPMFKPKGTDTVPAMLTPGEYTMRKAAVDRFGVRFMQRINNMDIRGAMRELSARAGHMATASRGNTYNYTTNNNQKLTQNINTSNPNFVFKRSNRFMAALT